jgi:hypothetical protein
MRVEVHDATGSGALSECGGEMEAGFMIDVAEAGVLQQKWARGLPVKGWLGISVKVKKEDCLLVETHRCKSCGYLKCYAK